MEKIYSNEKQKIDEFQKKVEKAIAEGVLEILESGNVAEFIKNNGGPGPGDTLISWSKEIFKRLKEKESI